MKLSEPCRWAFFLSTPLLFLAGCYAPRGEHTPQMMQTFQQKVTWDGEKDLQVSVNFPVGSLTLQAGDESELFSIESDYSSGWYQPDYRYDPTNRSLRFALKAKRENNWWDQILHKGGSFSPKNKILLRLSPKIPLEMNIKTGVGKSILEMGGLQTRILEVDSGVGEALLSCSKPNPIRCRRLLIHSGIGELEGTQLANLNYNTLDFKGGIGAARLDFSGVWQDQHTPELVANVGIGELSLQLPLDVGAEVRSSKHFLNNVSLDSFVSRDGRYLSENYERTQKRMQIQIHTGIGSVRVRWK